MKQKVTTTMYFTCREDESLPEMTLCASFQTARELRSVFPRRSFDIAYDETLEPNVVLISADLYEQLGRFLATQDQSEASSC